MNLTRRTLLSRASLAAATSLAAPLVLRWPANAAEFTYKCGTALPDGHPMVIRGREAMAKIKDFPGTWFPALTYGPTKFYGPSQYEVVRLHNNDPKHNACPLTSQNIPQGTCWQVVQPFKPLPAP